MKNIFLIIFFCFLVSSSGIVGTKKTTCFEEPKFKMINKQRVTAFVLDSLEKENIDDVNILEEKREELKKVQERKEKAIQELNLTLYQANRCIKNKQNNLKNKNEL